MANLINDYFYDDYDSDFSEISTKFCGDPLWVYNNLFKFNS